MSVLLRRSILVLGLLFGLLFAVGMTVLRYYDMNVLYAVVLAVVVVGLQYAFGPAIIGMVFKIGWVSPDDVNPEFARFLLERCGQDGIPVPRFGIIEDGRPNAFTYGHSPKDARVVVTRGLIQMLDEAELEAVVAHELGHIKHWDFVVMTVASLVPLMLYIIYAYTRGRRDALGYVAIGSYLAYIVSQYIALFLSRIREYYADRYSAESTRNPNALASALVKIAYGMATIPEKPKDEADGKKKKAPVFNPAGAMASLSFFSPKGAGQLMVAASGPSGGYSADAMTNAMRWDISNPWAKWFELNSTHPLPAKRIAEMQRLSGLAHQSAEYRVDATAVSYWPKFVQDFGVMLLPFIGAAVGFGLGALNSIRVMHSGSMVNYGMFTGFGLALLGLGVGGFIRTRFSYRDGFQPSEIVPLVGETEVSHIRPIPVELRGKIIGRGIPGLLWSSDLVIQDEHGFITLTYRQPLGIFEFLFGAFKAEQLIGQEATVRGWYRRGPGPYVEMLEARLDSGETVHCYYYRFLQAMCVVAGVIGLAVTLWSF